MSDLLPGDLIRSKLHDNAWLQVHELHSYKLRNHEHRYRIVVFNLSTMKKAEIAFLDRTLGELRNFTFVRDGEVIT